MPKRPEQRESPSRGRQATPARSCVSGEDSCACDLPIGTLLPLRCRCHLHPRAPAHPAQPSQGLLHPPHPSSAAIVAHPLFYPSPFSRAPTRFFRELLSYQAPGSAPLSAFFFWLFVLVQLFKPIAFRLALSVILCCMFLIIIFSKSAFITLSIISFVSLTLCCTEFFKQV